MKYLLVGDLHCQYSNLEDTKLLFAFIYATAREYNVDKIIYLGDIFHTHDVLRVGLACEIQNLFNRQFVKKEDVIVLAGNHDFTKPNASEAYNSVRLAFSELVTVIDKPVQIGEDAFVPFMGDNEEFIRVCNQFPEKSNLFCHQTFDSAVYENNFTAPGGVDQNRIKQKVIASGHIHKKQVLKNSHNTVYFIGTPRGLTANDANEGKSICVFENGVTEHISTDHIMKKFISLHIDEEHESEILKINAKEKDDVRIYVTGTEEFYERIVNDHSNGHWKFIPDIKKHFNKKIDIESTGDSTESAFYKYVHEVHDMNEDLKNEVWKKLQKEIPQLGNKT